MDLDHERVIAVANGKGGVLKTSVAANTGAILAQNDFRVLLIDLDPQGNLGLDLGYEDRGEGDSGQGLAQAIIFGSPLTPLKNVRPNLDVITGGTHTSSAAGHIASQLGKVGPKAQGALRRVLEPVLPRYDFVIIDCPPGDALLQQEALIAAKWVLFVSKSDRASLEGLGKTAALIEPILDRNPNLEILGAILTGVGSTSTSIREEALDYIRAVLGDAAPTFQGTVRHVEKAAKVTRDVGQLAVELSKAYLTQDPEGPKTSMDGLAWDYASIAAEFVRRFEEIEAGLQQEVK
ncbi:ParA family protein [Paenarthrobacter nicotinovorans]|uniref:ParA family protein n=1 Tax=Paenarthrobacter nicotinovorans TaxID=29320 RepID=UPI0011A72E01|nr:AAA family ATPase [Paenarthrobacter nicotinovorans]